MTRLAASVAFVLVMAGCAHPAPAPLTCRLPVTVQSGVGNGVTFQGGFIDFPAATLAPDPAGRLRDEPLQLDFATVATPTLRGQPFSPEGGVPFYDSAVRRWLPASAAQSTSDGAAYAWGSTSASTQTAEVHIVDARTGAARIFPAAAAGYQVSILDFAPAGVYLSSVSGIGGPSRGLWLLDPTSGKLTDLKQPDFAFGVRNGYLWSGSHTGPPTHEEYSPADTLYRVDLSSGARTTWYKGNKPISLMGFDGHDNPVLAGPYQKPAQSGEIRSVDAAGSDGLLISTGGPFTSALGDGDRIWFGSPDGIYLYQAGSGLRKVFAFAGDAQLREEINPAGFCR